MTKCLWLFIAMLGLSGGYAYGFTVGFQNLGNYKVSIQATQGPLGKGERSTYFDLEPGQGKSIETYTPFSSVTASLTLSEAMGDNWKPGKLIENIKTVQAQWFAEPNVAYDTPALYAVGATDVIDPGYQLPIKMHVKFSKGNKVPEEPW